MKRLTDWRSRLHAEMAVARESGPFVWGTNDCCTFVARCVEACTGVDYRSQFPSDYSDQAGALAAIESSGFEDLPALIASLFEECQPPFAHEGDIAVIPRPGHPIDALGIFSGERIFVLGMTGLATMPRRAATRAFRI